MVAEKITEVRMSRVTRDRSLVPPQSLSDGTHPSRANALANRDKSAHIELYMLACY